MLNISNNICIHTGFISFCDYLNDDFLFIIKFLEYYDRYDDHKHINIQRKYTEFSGLYILPKR